MKQCFPIYQCNNEETGKIVDHHEMVLDFHNNLLNVQMKFSMLQVIVQSFCNNSSDRRNEISEGINNSRLEIYSPENTDPRTCNCNNK